jgi:hypothetical protein
MLEKLKRIKFEIGKYNKPLVLVLEKDCGLVRNVLPYYKGKYDFIIGWNVYSVVRWVFESYKVKNVYRDKDGCWVKVKADKLKNLAYQPMKV